MTDVSISEKSPKAKPDWLKVTAKYERPSRPRAIWQMVNTLVPYFALWALMVFMVHRGVPYVFTLAVSVLAAGFLVRIFILFHDCCHGSLFASRRANTIVGYVTGILTFTSFNEWRRTHLIHHNTVGDLDRRGVGDIWTLTVEEYLAAPWWKRLAYRIVRNPVLMLGVGPAVIFLVFERFTMKGAKREDRRGVIITDLGVLAIILVASATMGFGTYVLIQLPVILVGGAMGIWLFYVQHQFTNTYWASHDEWDPVQAAVQGSSYYRLPKVLQWFSGNIGLHHIHHIRPRIPNYSLQRCYDETPGPPDRGAHHPAQEPQVPLAPPLGYPAEEDGHLLVHPQVAAPERRSGHLTHGRTSFCPGPRHNRYR